MSLTTPINIRLAELHYTFRCFRLRSAAVIGFSPMGFLPVFLGSGLSEKVLRQTGHLYL